MDNASLLKEIETKDFTVFKCIDYLRKHGDNIGIHHFLVQKLYDFQYDELEFFIPQFVQLIVSFETESMALEDFLLKYCAQYPHFSLIVFWNLQSYVFELRNEPDSVSFQIVRKFINKLQDILFNVELTQARRDEFRENLQPSLVLSGVIAASIAVPRLNNFISPIIKSQGRQQKSFVFKLANFQKSLTKNLTMKNKRISTEGISMSDDENFSSVPRGKLDIHQRSASVPRLSNKSRILSDESEAYTTDEEIEGRLERTSLDSKSSFLEKRIGLAYGDIEDSLKINTVIKSKKSLRAKVFHNDNDNGSGKISSYNLNTHSLPDLSKVLDKGLEPFDTAGESQVSLSVRHDSYHLKNKNTLSRTVPTYSQLLKLLHVNYSKKETDFMMALQNVSIRLSLVPKEARLSALRAELSIINDKLLPSEIDIPQLLPVTSTKNKYHKILKLSINEACVLNSAERVPFLLLIEYLSDEMDFNPFSEHNQKIILAKQNSHDHNTKDSTILGLEANSSVLNSPVASVPAESICGSPLINADSEADLTELPILSTNSSSHDLGKMKELSSQQSFVTSFGAESSVTLNINGPDPSTKNLADQMRIASVMLQQLDSSGQSTSEQSAAIRRRIVESMIALQNQFDAIDYHKLHELTGVEEDAGERKLENDFKLAEDWNSKKQRIRNSSIYGHLRNWDLCSVIAKNGDDLPQEAFACQLIQMISNIWKKKGVKAWTKRMKILITSANTGLVETITNSMSIHSIKKSLTEISIKSGQNTKGRIVTLQDYFLKMYGSQHSGKFKAAQENFARSLASYSIICYVLQIKDRHNGNIMIDSEGHLVHIDFGFLLSNSPGSVGFEAAPFKLTSEYIELLGGVGSPQYLNFVETCKQCFLALRDEHDQIISIVELMQKDSNLPCFNNGENTSVLLKQRLQLTLSDEEASNFVETALIGKSIGSMYTRLYDQFQLITQGIYS